MTSVKTQALDSEALRMNAVRRYDILDTPPDGSFDHVTQIAARLLDTPIAIISIVDTDRIWFKSHHGVDVEEIPREPGLCASAIMQKEPWLISNARVDPRTISNPLVAGDFGLQFYLGIPLETHDGFNLGTLCVLDFEPKTVSDDQVANLKELALVVVDQMELRLAARQSISALSEALELKEAALARHREAEAGLRISEERLRLAKEAAGLGVFEFDSKQNIIHWDEHMRELWGAGAEKWVPYEKFVTAIHPDDRAAQQAAVDRVIHPTGNGEYNSEFRIINAKDGVEHWLTIVGRMHFDDGQPSRLLAVARDVTDQKLLENKLQEQRDETELLFTKQVAARTASAIAHELNQPLGAISAYSEVALHALQNNPIDTAKLTHALDSCVVQAHRAGRSLHELLAFLQKGELVSEKLNLNDIIKEALEITRSCGYGVFHHILELEENMPFVMGNHIQVQKVLVNLLRNAVEAMRGAGVPISAIKVCTYAELNMAHVTVQDNGPGIDPETAKRIFDPFFTTKPKGIGMGLAISRALTEANGGQLWIDLANQPSATFHFTLPFAQ